MLDAALKFLIAELNGYLLARTGSDFGEAELSKLVDDSGKWAVKEDHLAASIINIEEERILKSHLPEHTYVAGQHVVVQPPLKLNVLVMFAANFKQYDQALKYISHVLTCFQATPVFAQTSHPGLDVRIEKLVLELQSLNYEQLNQIWAYIGGKQLPSVVYKVRLLALQDEAPTTVLPPITKLRTSVQAR